jgi:hypothetical protein
MSDLVWSKDVERKSESESRVLRGPGEDSAVSGEAGDGDADVVVSAEDLALVGGEFGGGLVDGGEDGVGRGAEADGGGALLDGLHGVLDLEKAAGGAPGGDVGVVLVAKHGLLCSSLLSVS